LDKPPTANVGPDTNAMRNLPAELILLIAERVDILSFRSTCHWHHGLTEMMKQKAVEGTVPDIHASPPNNLVSAAKYAAYYNLRDQMAVRFHLEQFQKLARIETGGTSSHDPSTAKLLCSYCLDLHPPSSFHSWQQTNQTNKI
jgi:hypothetical protein